MFNPLIDMMNKICEETINIVKLSRH